MNDLRTEKENEGFLWNGRLYGDADFIELISESRRKAKRIKGLLERKASGGEDYLELAIARLAYGFAREECAALAVEAVRRGLAPTSAV